MLTSAPANAGLHLSLENPCAPASGSTWTSNALQLNEAHSLLSVAIITHAGLPGLLLRRLKTIISHRHSRLHQAESRLLRRLGVSLRNTCCTTSAKLASPCSFSIAVPMHFHPGKHRGPESGQLGKTLIDNTCLPG